MRKQYKDKKKACGMCKPHKRHWACRWGVKDRDRLHRDDAVMREVAGSRKPMGGESDDGGDDGDGE